MLVKLVAALMLIGVCQSKVRRISFFFIGSLIVCENAIKIIIEYDKYTFLKLGQS